MISDRDVKFAGNLWQALLKGLGAQLNFSTTCHPQTDGQTERVNQILEDMLRMYEMDQPSKWEEYLYLVQFAYNNHFQISAKLSPFEILYGRKCNTPISLSSLVEKLMLGPDMLRNMELTPKHVHKNRKVAQDRQKCYADLKRTQREFEIRDHVYVKVKPRKISLSLGKYTKLALRYCAPFEVLAQVGLVAYQLALLAAIKVHNVFQVSLLKKYVHDATHVVD